ncbi:MAG: hypothetical protein FK730_14285 [Asgard group archaeon]|nr:hypothetical protein [Asgard group archaeon]
MGIEFQSSKKLGKLGIRLLIGLLSIDVIWTLARYIVKKVVYNDLVPDIFIPIDLIVTNVLFIICIGFLAIGVLFLSLHYKKISKLGLISASFLIVVLGIKIALIICQFIILINPPTSATLEIFGQSFELSFGLFFILFFVIFNFFQKQLKDKTEMGFGQGIIPYLFAFFALIFPITNILNLVNFSLETLTATALSLHILSYFATIIEVIVLFDLMRRIDVLEQPTNIVKEITNTESTE